MSDGTVYSYSPDNHILTEIYKPSLFLLDCELRAFHAVKAAGSLNRVGLINTC
jgi:hypothetical protein